MKNIAWLRMEKVLKKIDNDELLLLKGHLLIEESINKILEVHFSKEILKSLDLTFYKKVLLFSGITNFPLHSGIAGIILKINQLRNKLAHRLDLNLKDGFLQVFLSEYGEPPKTIRRKSTYLHTAKNMFYIILGELEGIREVSSLFKNEEILKRRTTL